MKNILIYASMILALLLFACGSNQKAAALVKAAASGENHTGAADMTTEMDSGMKNTGENSDRQDMGVTGTKFALIIINSNNCTEAHPCGV